MFVFSIRPGWDDAGVDRDRLRAYLEQDLSLIQIGALENRDPSTVGYWVRKYGFEANGRDRYAPRGGIERERLEGIRQSEPAAAIFGNDA